MDHIRSNWIWIDQMDPKFKTQFTFYKQCFDDFLMIFFSSNLHRGSRRHHRNNHHSSSTGSSASNMGGNVSSKFSKFKFIFKIRENLELVFRESTWPLFLVLKSVVFCFSIWLLFCCFGHFLETFWTNSISFNQFVLFGNFS